MRYSFPNGLRARSLCRPVRAGPAQRNHSRAGQPSRQPAGAGGLVSFLPADTLLEPRSTPLAQVAAQWHTGAARCLPGPNAVFACGRCRACRSERAAFATGHGPPAPRHGAQKRPVLPASCSTSPRPLGRPQAVPASPGPRHSAQFRIRPIAARLQTRQESLMGEKMASGSG